MAEWGAPPLGGPACLIPRNLRATPFVSTLTMISCRRLLAALGLAALCLGPAALRGAGTAAPRPHVLTALECRPCGG